MTYRKYCDVDVVALLEEKLKENTRHYLSDFEIDKDMFARVAASPRKEDRTLLWLSRESGTHCVKEHDAFIKGTAAFQTWQYFSGHKNDTFIAAAIELTGVKDGILRGNVYELNYFEHAAEVLAKAVEAKDIETRFEDGHVEHVPFENNRWLVQDLVEKHGKVADFLHTAENEEDLRYVLEEQRTKRSAMKPSAVKTPGSKLESRLSDARVRAASQSISKQEVSPERT